MIEQDTRFIIDSNLTNKNWILNSNAFNRNVFFETAKTEIQKKKLKGKRPDYVLYQKGTDRAIAIIEAKKGGVNLEPALKQATEYAEILEAPLIFASNGAYVETKHLTERKELFINGEEVNRFIQYSEAIKFIEEGKNEIYTVSPELIKSKEELIRIFKKVNALLRKANIFSGYDRISEFSNILFLKLISEQQGEKSWWNSIKKQDDEFLFTYLNNTIIKELEGKYGGDVFSQTNIKKPALFRQIMNMINPLLLSEIKTDIKGDAFEYFLKNMNQADNDLGQYFTPRHIVQAMVHLVDPKFKETVYDPFCGTGGFLIESFNHIKRNTILETEEDKRILTEKTLFGRDSTKVSTIAKKNMILHGDGHSNVEELDSLENVVEGKYNCIITNIPFSLKDVDYSHLYYNSLARKNGDAICVLHCLKALKEGGRMALIAPEGFLFKKELKSVREMILKNSNLELVISLPQGTFLPYTGVKTDILYFANAHKPKKQEGYYYFEVKNDGYTLDNHRRKIMGIRNDIHTLEENDLKRLERNPELKVKMEENGFEFIPFSKIEEHDYNLVGVRYREVKKHTGKWEMVSLSSVLEVLESGSRPKGGVAGINEGAISLGGEQVGSDGNLELSKTPFVPLDFYKKASKGFVKDSDILICKDGALTGKVCIVDFKLFSKQEVMINEHVYIMRGKSDVINQSYLFYCLYSQETQSQIKKLAYNKSAQPGLNKEHIDNIQIPLPPLEEQEKVAEALDNIQKSINNAKSLIDNLKRGGGAFFRIYGNEEFESMQLGKICDIKSGGTPNTEMTEYWEKGSIPWLTSAICKNDIVESPTKFITEEGLKNSSAKWFEKDTVLVALVGATIGKVGFLPYRSTTNQNIAGIYTKNQNILNQKYLFYALQTLYSKFTSLSNDSYRMANLSFIKSLQIPVPPLSIQQEIVSQLDTEIAFIKQTEEVINKQEEKIKQVIARLWQENEAKITPIVKELPNAFDLLLEKAAQPFLSKK